MLNNTISHKETNFKNDIIEKNDIKNGDLSSNEEKNRYTKDFRRKRKLYSR